MMPLRIRARNPCPFSCREFMSRAVTTFAVFCLLLLGLFGAVGWWVGWPLVDLAFDPDRRAAPYHVLLFDDAGAAGNGARPDATAYLNALDALLTEAQAPILWQASQLTVPVGQVADEWERLLALRFPAGSGFVRVVTGRNYSKLGALAPGNGRNVLGLAAAPRPQALGSQLLIVGAQFDDVPAAQASAALREAFAGAQALGGRVYWDSAVAVLEGPSALSHMVIYAYDSPIDIDEWLFSSDTATTLALLGTRFSNLRLWRVSGVVR